MTTFGGTYSTGTVTVTNGSATVPGAGVVWADVEEGDWLWCGGVTAPIAAVNEALDALTLMQPWPGATAAGAAYLILKNSWLRYDPAITQAKLRTFLTDLEGLGHYFFVQPAATPDNALGDDGQWAIRPNDMTRWLKGSGVWTQQPWEFGGPLALANGSVGAPGLAFSGDPNTGLYWIGPDNLGIACGGGKIVDVGTTQVLINLSTPSTDPTTGALRVPGGVGIGGMLNVSGGAAFGGDITISRGGNNAFIVLSNSNQSWGLLDNFGDGTFSLLDFNHTLFPFIVASGAPTGTVYVSASGNVGIRTTSPDALLTLGDVASITGTIRLKPGAGGSWWDVTNNSADFNIIQVSVGTRFKISATAGQVSVLSTIDATTTTDGALSCAGGLSVAKTAVIGGRVIITNSGTDTLLDLNTNSNGWRLFSSAGGSHFGVWETSTNYFPFVIYPNAPSSTISLMSSGLINVGRSMQIGSATGGDKGAGTINIASAYYINGAQVVGARDTGWTAMTGSTNKATVYDTSTVTLAQLAGRVMALQAALTTHGLLGA